MSKLVNWLLESKSTTGILWDKAFIFVFWSFIFSSQNFAKFSIKHHIKYKCKITFGARCAWTHRTKTPAYTKTPLLSAHFTYFPSTSFFLINKTISPSCIIFKLNSLCYFVCLSDRSFGRCSWFYKARYHQQLWLCQWNEIPCSILGAEH